MKSDSAPSRGYPIAHRNLELEELYEKKYKENINKIFGKHKFSFKEIFIFFSLLLILIAVPFSIYRIRQSEEMSKMAKASEAEVKFFIFPKENQVTKDKSFSISTKLLGPNDKKISSVLVSISFNESHLKLQEINEESSDNKINYLRSTLESANRTGKIKVLLGAGSKESAPTGLVNLIKINFKVLSTASSEIRIDPAESQVVFIDGKVAKIKVDNNAKVDSNIVVSIAPTVVSTPVVATLSPTFIPTVAPTINVSPTVIPTNIVVPTNTIITSPISTSSATPEP